MKRFQETASMSPTRPLDMLQQKSKRLISDFLKGQAPGFPEQHSGILDEYFRDCFEESRIGPKMGIARNPYAIVALGGYGREELCVHSDIDLLFLFGKTVPPVTEDLIKEVVYPLWDLGYDVGHVTRSLKECLGLAAKDIEVLTALLDARFICGSSLLYSELMSQIQAKVLGKRSVNIISKLVENNVERHERFGDSSYLLEPNLKEGQGGLRDYHTMLWIARIESNIMQPRDLEICGYLTHPGYRDLCESLSFILNVRNHLHYMAGRKCDQLHLEYQTPLAKKLEFRRENGQKPVEQFLGGLHGHMESLKEQYLLFILEQGYTHSRKRKPVQFVETDCKGLEVQRGMLFFESSEGILKTPELLMRIFEESARLRLPLSGEAKHLVGEFGFLVDDRFRKSPANLRSFEKILTAPAHQFSVLSEMLSTGFLACYIPAFKGITHRIQYDEYHIYPVDKHSLLTVRTAKNFGNAETLSSYPLCHNLYKALPNKKLLLWAALLHDIGKGRPGEGHSEKGADMAKMLLTDFGFSPRDIDTIVYLIRAHLFVANTATRRDINDEETAIFCARGIKDPDRLKMLYLLTVADSMTTGPKAWNEWTGALIRNLFFKVLSTMEKGELATEEAILNVERKQETLLASVPDPKAREELGFLLKFMSPRYLLYSRAEEMVEHVKLYKALGDRPFAWNILRTPESNTRTITVCATDRPGLFSKIAGTFTLNGLNILHCQIYTWRNNVALDIFEVEAPVDQLFENERWQKVAETLGSVLSGQLDIAAALEKKMPDFRTKPGLTDRPNQVIIDNTGSSFFTIIEVFAYDFPGLLFSITNALFRCGLDIWIAKIATKIDQVVDVFYVRDFDGQKVDSPQQEETIRKAVLAVLPSTMPGVSNMT
jgi:[protein-PII] uridylyltransferase